MVVADPPSPPSPEPMHHLYLVGFADIFARFHDLGDHVATWGPLGVLLVVAGDGVFPVLPGETAIVAASVLAAQGKGNILFVIAAAMIGAIIGDSAAFWIGRWGAGPIRRALTRMVGEDRYAEADAMVERNARPLVIGGRFLPGLRIAVNMACGSGHLSYPRFLAYDSIGATVWATQAALLGYFAGKAFAQQTWVAFVVAGAVMVVVALVIGRRERSMKRAHEAREAEAVSEEADHGPTSQTGGAPSEDGAAPRGTSPPNHP